MTIEQSLRVAITLAMLFGSVSAEDRRPKNAAGAGQSSTALQSPAVREYLPRLVIYTAPEWCEPCRRLDKEVKRLESLDVGGKAVWAGKIGPGTQHAVQVIDASCDPSPEMTLAKKSRVTSWPTTIRLDADGKEEWRYTGVLTAEQLSRFQAGTEYPGRPARKVNRITDGLHTHRCSRCATQWAHSPETITDHVAAHRCPTCQMAQFEIDHMGPVH